MKILKTFTQNLLLMLIVAALLASCAKGKQGEVGPQGDKGDAGAKGATGSAGAAGATGATGTANVIYSDWLTAKNPRDTIVDNAKLKIADLTASQLTSALLSNASMQIYIDYGAGVFPLPYTSYAGFKESTISYFPRVGRFIITRFTTDNSGLVSLSLQMRYRYIIIPGGKAVATAGKINMNNYQEVKRTYNIPN
jgi:hypothetical protein